MDIYFLHLKKLEKYKWLGYVLLAAIFVVCFFKLFYCSISIDGTNVQNCMVADYYNFAKNMLNGKILYKDLLDHKGLYLYAMYLFAMQFSGGNPMIVPIVETLIFTLTIGACFFLCYKANKNKNVSLLYAFLFSLAYFEVTKFSVLFNTEGLLAIVYFLLFSYVVRHKKVTPKSFFVIGLVMGVFLNIKYASIVIFFSLFIYETFLHFYHKYSVKLYVKSIIFGILGIVVVNIPFVAYFIQTNTYEYYLSSMAMASGIDKVFVVFCIVVAIMMLVIAFKNYAKGNETKAIRFLSLSCSFMILIGGIVSDTYVAYLVATFFPFVFYEDKIDLSVFFYFGFIAYFIYLQYTTSFLQADCFALSTKDAARKYGINNSNIFYLTEDIGFGIYSEETFVEPYQWIPFRYFAIEDISREIIELEKERLQTQRFEFVFVDGKLTTEEGRTSEKTFGYEKDMYEEIVPILIENYEPIDQCLWRRKEK